MPRNLFFQKPVKEYPGAVIKISADGKEMDRYDPLRLSEDQWTFASATACMRWGTDILFVADPPLNNIHPRVVVKGKELGPDVAIRMRPDLSIVWTRALPVYHPGRIISSRPRVPEISGGNLLLNGIDRAVVINPSGDVLQADTYNYCLLLNAEDMHPAIQTVCREDASNSQWQLYEMDGQLHHIRSTSLGKPVDVSACFVAPLFPGASSLLAAAIRTSKVICSYSTMTAGMLERIIFQMLLA